MVICTLLFSFTYIALILYHVATVNLWELMSAAEDQGRKYLEADGLHLSFAGHQLLYEEICKFFNKDELESLVQFPLWRAYDLKDPSSYARTIEAHRENFLKLRNWTHERK